MRDHNASPLFARQASDLWVRVVYRGREDGWVLTANKRGQTLVPSQDPASAAEDFETQEAAFAKAAAAAAESGNQEASRDDRPLTGAKASALDAGGEERPLAGGGDGGGGKEVMVPLSQSAPGYDEGLTATVGSDALTADDGRPGAEEEAKAGGVTAGGDGPVKYMTALG